MKRFVQTAFVVLVGLTVVALPLYAQKGQAVGGEQRGRGPGGEQSGGMMGFMYLEHSWAALCFEVGISADQIAKLRPTYQQAWKTRNAAVKTAMDKHDFESMSTAAAKTRETLDAAIKSVLSKQQMSAWTKWQAEQAKRFQRRGPGGPAGQGRPGG